MNWFLLLKTLHVLSAIIAVGSNATYGVWSALGKRDPEHLGFVLQGIRFVDSRMANPAYVVLLATGLIMAFTTYTITTSWILIGLGVYVFMALAGVAVYAPLLSRQMETLERRGAASPEYAAVDARARGIGIFLGVLALFALYVMVFKPSF